MIWKYTNHYHRIVVSEDGRRSGLATALVQEGDTVLEPDPPTQEQRIAAHTRAVQAWLDKQAQVLGYDDIRSAVTYADEPIVPRFQQEGRALRSLRSWAWARCYEILGEVQAGSRAEPTPEELVALLSSTHGI